MNVTFRYAQREDTALILRFIRELAEYEELLDEVVADEATLEEWIFDRQKAEVILRLRTGARSDLRCFFTISRPSSVGRGYIWRICMSDPSAAGGAMARRF